VRRRVTPSPSRIQSVADNADLEDVYETERHLLYVACTRAHDHLLVTGVEPASEFLDDLRAGESGTDVSQFIGPVEVREPGCFESLGFLGPKSELVFGGL